MRMQNFRAWRNICWGGQKTIPKIGSSLETNWEIYLARWLGRFVPEIGESPHDWRGHLIRISACRVYGTPGGTCLILCSLRLRQPAIQRPRPGPCTNWALVRLVRAAA